MPDNDLLSTIFFQNDPNVNQQLRQRIALAMMASKRSYPKSLGEGLSAIGEAFGERSIAQRMMKDDLADQAGAKSVEGSLFAPAPAAAAAAAPPATAAAPVADAPPPNPALTGDAPVASPAISDPPPANAGQASLAPPGFRPPPAYLAAALNARIQDPNRRAYLGHLASKEARSPNAVSPTGAAGPFQFTRGTGSQYGLVGPQGDQRTNVDASVDAANKLTDDNAATLARSLGREPTPAELALAHQQGAGTAAKMLTGTGNAPARNLAVNNAGGLGPQAASQKIMAYYGMPGASGASGPRDAAAAVIASRTPPGAPVAPDQQDALLGDVISGGGARSAPFNPTAALGRNDIQSDAPSIGGSPPVPIAPQVRPAPPAAPPILKAPDMQVAQAQPGAVPGYVMPKPVDPARPPILRPGPEELRVQKLINDNQNNPYAVQRLTPYLQREQADRAGKQSQLNKEYEDKLIHNRALDLEREKQLADQLKRQHEADKLKEEADKLAYERAQGKRFGGLSREFYEKGIEKSAEVVKQTGSAGMAINNAMDAARSGMFTGKFANAELATAKIMGALGAKIDPRVATTEQFKAYVAPIWAAARQAQAGGANISDADIKNAQSSVAGDITLDEKTIPAVLASIQRLNVATAVWHQRKLGALAGEDPQAQSIIHGTYGLPMEQIVPREAVAELRAHAKDPAALAEFDKAFATPGLARRILGGR